MKLDLERMLDRLIAPPFIAAACFFSTGAVMYIGAVYNQPAVMFSAMGFFIGGAATTAVYFLGKHFRGGVEPIREEITSPARQAPPGPVKSPITAPKRVMIEL